MVVVMCLFVVGCILGVQFRIPAVLGHLFT